MESESSFEDSVPGVLASLGIETSETDLIVMRAAHTIWWPVMGELLAADLSEVEPEPLLDLSRSPQP
jgi:hypothetical protein